MKRAVTGIILLSCAGRLAFSQSTEAPTKFEAVDVHLSAKTRFPFPRPTAPHGGRYELKTATMVDLISAAYGFNADKVLGGPNWLEMDRFDVIAKVPQDTTPDSLKPMLQSLLADRFKLVVHKDTRPLPTYALSVGKKHQLKQAEGTGDPGCKPQSSGATGQGGGRLMTTMNGVATTINFGPGGTIQYECRNMTMASFVDNLHTMFGANLGSNPILNETGLEGRWNFDLTYSALVLPPMMGGASDRVTLQEAIEKQLGLKLEEKQVPTPVIVVDSVNRKPIPNDPDLAKVLPPIPVPTEFDVASVKLVEQDARMGGMRTQPGGRFTVEGMPLTFLISRAFNSNSPDQIVGIPSWAGSERVDVTAKAAFEGTGGPIDNEALAPMILNLLKDRFKLTYHTEERPATAYSLVAAKPKMKKADPDSRTFCKSSQPPPGSPPGSRLLTCQNITMAQFTDQLQFMTPELSWPVADATEIEGGWDFTLMFSMAMQPAMMAGAPRGGDAPTGAVPTVSEPTPGLTIFEAMEKQLGLKLTMQKRPMPVYVIDHIDQKPTDN